MSSYIDRLIEEEYDELEKLKVLEDITWKETFRQGMWQTSLQPMVEGHIPMWAHKVRSQMAPDTDVYKDSPFTLGSSFVLPEDHFEDRKEKLLDFSHQAWERAHELTRDRLNTDSDLFDAEYAAYHLKVANAKILEKGMFDMNIVKKAIGNGLPSMGIAWGGGILAGAAGTLAGGPVVGVYAGMATVATLTGLMEGSSEFSEAVDYNMELGMSYEEATNIAAGTAAAYALASAFLEGVLPVARVGRWLFPGLQAKWIKTAFGSMKGKMGAKYMKFGRTWYGKPVNNILAQGAVESLEEFLQYAAQTSIQTQIPGLAYKEESFGEVFDWEEALSGAYGGLLLGSGMGAAQTASDYTSVPQRIRDINAEPELGETNLLIKKNKETGLYELQVWNAENELAHEPDVYNSYKEARKARDTILANLEALWEAHQKIQDQGETPVQEDDKKADGAPVTPPTPQDLQRSTQELLMLSFLGKEGDLSTEEQAELEKYKIQLAGEGKTEIQQIEDLVNTAPNILEAMGVTPEEFMQSAEEAGIDIDPAIFEGAEPLITPEAGEVASSDIPGPEGGVVATPEEDVPVVPEVPPAPQEELFPDEPSPQVPEEPEFPEPPKVGEDLEQEVKDEGGALVEDDEMITLYRAVPMDEDNIVVDGNIVSPDDNNDARAIMEKFGKRGVWAARKREDAKGQFGKQDKILKFKVPRKWYEQKAKELGLEGDEQINMFLGGIPEKYLVKDETPIRESKIKKPEKKGTIVGEIRKAMGIREREKKVPISGEVGITSVLRQMQLKFAADFQTVDEDGTIRNSKGEEIGQLKKGEIRKAGRLVQREDGTWIPRIDFSQARASDAFHEYAHPLLHNLYQENPEEFQRLIDEMMATDWGKKLMQVVYENYSKDYDLEHLFQEEALAHAIGWFASEEYFDKISPEEQGAFIQWITKVFNFIKDQINRMFKVPPLPEFDMVDPTTIKNITIQDIVEWMSNEEISISTHPIWSNRGWDMADRMAGLETMSNTSLTGDMSALILYGERRFARSETQKQTVESVIKIIEYFRDKVLKVPNPKKKIEKWKIVDIKRIEGKIKNLSNAIIGLNPLSDIGTNFVDEAASEIVIKVLEEQDMGVTYPSSVDPGFTQMMDPQYGISETKWLDFFGQLEVLEATYPIVDKLRLMDSDRPIPIHDESLFGGLSKAEKKVFSEFINELTENSTAMFDDTPTNNELHLAAIISLNGTIPYNDAVKHIQDFRAGKQQTLPASLLADLFESWVKTRYGIKHMATDRLTDGGNNVYGINSQTASKYGIKRLGLDPNETDLERVQLLQDFTPHTDTLHGFEGKGTDYKAPRLFIGYSWYTLISRANIPPLSIESQSNLKPNISSSLRTYLSQKDKVSSTKEGVVNTLIEDSLERVGISISQQIPLIEVHVDQVVKWIQSEGYTDEQIKSEIHAITHESIPLTDDMKRQIETINNVLFEVNIIMSILKSTFGEYNRSKNKYEYKDSKKRREMEKFGRDLNNKILENSTDLNTDDVWTNPTYESGQRHKYVFIEDFLGDYNSMDTKYKILGNITEEDVVDALSRIRIPTSSKYIFDEGYATILGEGTSVFEEFIHDTQNNKEGKIAGMISSKYHRAITMAIFHVILTKAPVFYGTPKMIAQASLLLQEEGNIPHVFKAELSKDLLFQGVERMIGYNPSASIGYPATENDINSIIQMLFFSGVEFPGIPDPWGAAGFGHNSLSIVWEKKDFAKIMKSIAEYNFINDYDLSKRHPFHLSKDFNERVKITRATEKEMGPEFDHSGLEEVPEIKGMPFLETRLKPGQLVETGSKLIYNYRTIWNPTTDLKDVELQEKVQPTWQTPKRIRNVGMYINKLFHNERWRRIQAVRMKTEVSNKLDRLQRWIDSLTKGEEASRQWFLDLVSISKEINEVNKSYRLDDIAPLMHTKFETTDEGIAFIPESDPNYNDYDRIVTHFTGGNVPTHWKQEWLHQFAIAQASGHSEMYSIGAQLSHVVQGNDRAYPIYVTESEALYRNLLNWYDHITPQAGSMAGSIPGAYNPATLWGQALVDGFINWVDNGKGVKTLKGLEESFPNWVEPKGGAQWWEYLSNLKIFKEWAFAVEFGVPIMGVVEKDVSKYVMTSESNFDRSESPYFDQEIAYAFWGKKKVKKPGGRKGEVLEPAREGFMGLSRRNNETRPSGVPKATEIAARNTALRKLESLGYVQVTEIPARDVPMLREVLRPGAPPVDVMSPQEEIAALQAEGAVGLMVPVPEWAPTSTVIERMGYFPAYRIKFLKMPGEAVPRWSKLDINESKEEAINNPSTPESPKRPPLTPDNPEWSKWFNIIESAYKKVSRRADLNHFPIQLRAWLDTVTDNIPDYILPVFEKWQAQTHIQNIVADGNMVSDLIGNVRYGSDAKVLSVAEAEDFFSRVSEDFFNELEGELGEEIQVSEGSTFKIRRIAFSALRVTLTAKQVAELVKATQHDAVVFMNEDIAKITHVSEFTEYQARMMFRFWLAHRTQVTVNQGQPGLQEKDNIVWTFDNGKIQLKGEKNPWSLEKTEDNYNDVNPSKEREFLISRLYRELKGVIRNKASLVFMQKHDLIALPQWAVEANRVDVQLKSKYDKFSMDDIKSLWQTELKAVKLVPVALRGEQGQIIFARVRPYMERGSVEKAKEFWKEHLGVNITVDQANRMMEGTDYARSENMARFEALNEVIPGFMVKTVDGQLVAANLLEVFKRLKIPFTPAISNPDMPTLNAVIIEASKIRFKFDGKNLKGEVKFIGLPKKYRADGATFASRDTFRIFVKFLGLSPSTNKVKNVIYQKEADKLLAYKHEVFPIEPGMSIYDDSRLVGTVDEKGNIIDPNGNVIDMVSTDNEAKLIQGYEYGENIEIKGESFGLLTYSDLTKKNATFPLQWLNYMTDPEVTEAIRRELINKESGPIVKRLRQAFRATLKPSNMATLAQKIENAYPDDISSIVIEKFYQGSGINPDNEKYLDRALQSRLVGPAIGMEIGNGYYAHMYPNLRQDLGANEVALAYKDVKTTIIRQYKDATGDDAAAINDVNKWLEDKDIRVLVARSPITYIGGVNYARVARLHTFSGLIEASAEITFKRQEADHDGDAMQVEFLPETLDELFKEKFDIINLEATAIDLDMHRDFDERIYDFSVRDDVADLMAQIVASDRARASIASIQGVYGIMEQVVTTLTIGGLTIRPIPRDKVMTWENIGPNFQATAEEMLRLHIQAATDVYNGILLDKWEYNMADLFISLFETVGGIPLRDFKESGSEIYGILLQTLVGITNNKSIYGAFRKAQQIKNGGKYTEDWPLSQVLKESIWYNEFVINRESRLRMFLQEPEFLEAAEFSGSAVIEDLATLPARMYLKDYQRSYHGNGPAIVAKATAENAHVATMQEWTDYGYKIQLLDDAIQEDIELGLIPSPEKGSTAYNDALNLIKLKARRYAKEMGDAWYVLMAEYAHGLPANVDYSEKMMVYVDKFHNTFRDFTRTGKVLSTIMFLESDVGIVTTDGKRPKAANSKPPYSSKEGNPNIIDWKVMKDFNKLWHQYIYEDSSPVFGSEEAFSRERVPEKDASFTDYADNGAIMRSFCR